MRVWFARCCMPFICYCQTNAVSLFETQGCQKSDKSEMHWMTSEWLLATKSTIYIPIPSPQCLNFGLFQFPPRRCPKFDPFRSTTSLYSGYNKSYYSRLNTMLNAKHEQTTKNCQNFKFHNSLNNCWLVETLPKSMNGFGGVNLMCTFRGDVVWNLLAHGHMLNENEKIQKFRIIFWEETK